MFNTFAKTTSNAFNLWSLREVFKTKKKLNKVLSKDGTILTCKTSFTSEKKCPMGWRGLRAKGSGTALWTWSRRRYSLTLHRSPSGVQNKWRFVNQLVLLEHKYRALTLSHWALRVAASTLWRYQNVDRYDYTDFFDTNSIPRLFKDHTLTKFPNTDTLFPRPIFLQRYRDPQKWQKPWNRDITRQQGGRSCAGARGAPVEKYGRKF